jgi:bifunctional DNA-binding transcriptional regulator/antitoxin component of YhaV-PrlF toxin-antitoxin module
MPTLNERSVINLGQGSYVITLPKDWIRYFDIKPGDKLEIVSNGELRIFPPKRQEVHKSTREIKNGRKIS